MIRRRYTATAALLVATLALAAALVLEGCGDIDPVRVETPNAAPDTRLGGESPVRLEAGFEIHLWWSGSDPDGEVRGFEYRLIPVGTDGLDKRDLEARDKDGELLHPWIYTETTEERFVLEDYQAARDPLFPPAWTMLVRAVDERGAVDPSPAYLSFTSTTLLPSIHVDRPPALAGYTTSRAMAPTVRFGWVGTDPDAPGGRPVKVRFLWKRSLLDGEYIDSEYEMLPRMGELVSFADSNWSDWFPYYEDPDDNVVTFPDQPARDELDRLIHYVFALQAMDTCGAVSIDRIYAVNVHNVWINEAVAPQLAIVSDDFGIWQTVGLNGTRSHDIAAGMPLQFSWVGSAVAYFGEIASYRWGWDVVDPDDPLDPGWAVMPGLTPLHMQTPETSFTSGVHTLTIECADTGGGTTRARYILSVVPLPDLPMRRPLLLVDDVRDRASNAWPDPGGQPLDNDVYRDAFWTQVLTGAGGVIGFDPVGDVHDAEVDPPLGFRDLVDYRLVIWNSRWTVGNLTTETFQPEEGALGPFNWLQAFQAFGGNLLLTGPRIANEFIEDSPAAPWMIPWVFDTAEEYLAIGGGVYRVGFGTVEYPDGTEVPIGPQRYPYAALGLATLDHVTPAYYVYGATGSGSSGSTARHARCAGAKGLVLDDAFAAAHGVSGAFADTILTDAGIDWRYGTVPEVADLGATAWSWGRDEIYDANLADRPTPWAPLDCGGVPCVEPMFRLHSRFDWADQWLADRGEPDWPWDRYEDWELEAACGRHTFDGSWNVRTAGTVLGFVSHRFEDTIPTGVPNMVWGFDPYRFDHAGMQDAIRWTLGQHFGLTMAP